MEQAFEGALRGAQLGRDFDAITVAGTGSAISLPEMTMSQSQSMTSSCASSAASIMGRGASTVIFTVFGQSELSLFGPVSLQMVELGAYLRAKLDGVPEERLELMREYLATALELLQQQSAPPDAMAGGPGPMPPEGMPMGPEVPQLGPPQMPMQ